MTVRKGINVATTKFTDVLTAGADVTITHAKITNAAGSIERIKPTALTAPFTLSAGQRAEIKDNLIGLENSAGSGMSDAYAAILWDDPTVGFQNTDLIVWMTSATVVTNRLPATVVSDWAATV